MGTRRVTRSALRMRKSARATTCWHQKMSRVSQLHVTDVILHLQWFHLVSQRSRGDALRERTHAPSSRVKQKNISRNAEIFHEFPHLSKLTETLYFLSMSSRP